MKGKVVDDDNDDTLELDPHTQVLIEELNISIESAQQLLQQFGSEGGVEATTFGGDESGGVKA